MKTLFARIVIACAALGASSVAAAGSVEDPVRFGQPASERETQQTLPQSHAPVWSTLRLAKVSEDTTRGVVTIVFPPDVRALNGRTVTLSGFMMPLDAEERSRHFMLSRYTPVCFFCPPGQPNEVVEVSVGRGVAVTDRMLTVTGRLTMTDRAGNGLFFRLDQATAR